MDSGTENLDWCARSIRRIVEFTQAGGEINVVVDGINVGAQPYWNAEATMLMHTRGILVMTAEGAMVLTGKQRARLLGRRLGRGQLGHRRLRAHHGPERAGAVLGRRPRRRLRAAAALLRARLRRARRALPRRAATADPVDRDVAARRTRVEAPTRHVGDVLSPRRNPGRKKPFDIRRVMRASSTRPRAAGALADMRDAESRWSGMRTSAAGR
jgi:hypothetical protein